MRAAWLVIVLVLASGAIVGVRHGLSGRPNWGSLQRESHFVWEQGHSSPDTALFGYLPTAVFALWPFTTWTPQPVGLLLYVAVNLLAAAGSAWMLALWWLPSESRAGSIVWPLLLVVANVQHVIQANQLTLWVLFLCVAGLTLIGTKRPLLGGVFLGLAALLKSMPFIFLGYLALRRKWWALAGFGIAIVAADLVPCLLFFGVKGTVDEHLAWFNRVEWHSNRRLIEDPLLRVNRHGSNASYSAVLTRWLRDPSTAQRQIILRGDPPLEIVAERRAALAPDEWLTLDPMIGSEQKWSEQVVDLRPLGIPRMHLAELSATAVWWIWASSLTCLLAALAILTWRCPEQAWAPLGSLWLLAMLWPSPMMRHYYLALAFPAVVIVWRTLIRVRTAESGRWTCGARLAVAALAGWLIGVACLGWGLPRWYGIHLAAIALLAAATVWSVRAAWRE
jgi:hypothetical protein